MGWGQKKSVVFYRQLFLIPGNQDLHLILEPGHEKMCLMSHANNKGADQPAHPRGLISAFVVRCLDSIISPDSIASKFQDWS